MTFEVIVRLLLILSDRGLVRVAVDGGHGARERPRGYRARTLALRAL